MLISSAVRGYGRAFGTEREPSRAEWNRSEWNRSEVVPSCVEPGAPATGASCLPAGPEPRRVGRRRDRH
ncbi:protein of unknown function [Streptomyces sp. KY75]|nr:protein of unknown function [Streptomyces sp. KY75]